jgi:hypothetical protein
MARGVLDRKMAKYPSYLKKAMLVPGNTGQNA